jgi:8-oxo-dGTP diphosphatase
VTVRAVFYEEDHARLVAARLRAAGFDAAMERERFAGEDDEEDHPWMLLTDAPSFMVDVLVEEHDGWVDDGPDGVPRPPVAPLDLPDAPRRVKGHFRSP